MTPMMGWFLRFLVAVLIIAIFLAVSGFGFAGS